MSYNDGVNSTDVYGMPQTVDAYNNNKESDEEDDEHDEPISISRKKVK